VHLTLIHTADIHSRLFPYNLQLGQIDAGLGLGASSAIVNVGGAARVSHVVGRERARADRVLHLDGGDCFQGAPVFNFFSGEAEVRTLSAMGTDASLIANHEFDRGALNLGIQLQRWADFPVLAGNYTFQDPSVPGAPPLASIVKPFTVFDVRGLKVGVIGMGNLSSLTSIFDNPNRLGITPLNTTETAQFYVDLLRPEVDVVVVLSHLGLDVDERMIQTTSGIDVVLGGHNHIVLQPPKRVQDCSQFSETVDGVTRNFILLDGAGAGQGGIGCQSDADCGADGVCYAGVSGTTNTSTNVSMGTAQCKTKRFCTQRDVVLAHSGAFAKFVGRLDLLFSNDPAELPPTYDPIDGFEAISHDYQLFPVTEQTPQDPVVSSLLEPYAQGLDALGNLELLVGYALDGSKRNSTGGGDSPLGNLIGTAMWLRLGIQTDFALTNTTGIRTDLVRGPVTVEQMYNIFPFDNAITKMNLSGFEVQELFDFVARRSSGRGCVSQVQIAGARVVMDCTQVGPQDESQGNPGVATHIYIGAYLDQYNNPVTCKTDIDCPDQLPNQCDLIAGVCFQPIQQIASYELATSDYLAGGGSGFIVLKRNTTQNNTGVQQRDALIDYIRAGFPCGADADGKLTVCSSDAECAGVGDHYVCACPDAVQDTGAQCLTLPAGCTGKGACVLQECRDDVATFQRQTCLAAPNADIQAQCESNISPCVAGGEQCKFLACLDRRLGNYSDGRIQMVGQ
jgi:5'-nucleotidase / UDP-sugar diphosphatase